MRYALSEDTTPKLIFLNYTISKDEKGQIHIGFINKIITDGKLKNSNIFFKTGSKGDLKCSQLDKDSIEITSVIVQNPLVKIIEYVNDSLIFEKKELDLNRSNLSLRLHLHSKTKYISISEITDKPQTGKSLITTKLD